MTHPIQHFFTSLTNDINRLLDDSHPSDTQEIRDILIKSVALRTLGLGLGLVAAASAIASVVTLNPVGIVASAVIAVFAHDFLVMGNNLSDLAGVFSPLDISNLNGFLNDLTSRFETIRNATATRKDRPEEFTMNGTVLVGPLSNFFASLQN